MQLSTVPQAQPLDQTRALRTNDRLSRFDDILAVEGNSSVRPNYQRSRGAMKQSKFKTRPTRDDLAAAWKIIRDQALIIKLQAEKIRRQDQVLGNVLLAYPRLEELRVN
jgi:hypothetical protein